jgi:hypothetical protein
MLLLLQVWRLGLGILRLCRQAERESKYDEEYG